PRPVALVPDLLVDGAFDRPDPALDGALDVVVGHRGGLGLLDGGGECRVEVGITAAFAGGDLDPLRQLGEQLAAGRVLAALAVFDVCPFGMSGHAAPSTSRWRRDRGTSDGPDRRR